MHSYRLRGLVAAIFISILFSASSTSAAVTCPSITRTLSFGSKGSDVSVLQTYLASDPSLYPEASVTGYFGRATEKAVQRFQAARNIVKSGTPATTGYGSVGAKTRAALLACASTKPAAPASTTPATIQTTPVTTPVTQTPTSPLITFTDGATTTITVGTGVTPTITNFLVAPRVVDVTNASTTIYWATSDALTCNIEKTTSGGYSVLSADAGVNGTIILPVPENPTTYSLNCRGRGDNSSSTATSIRREVAVRIAHPTPSCTVKTDKTSYAYGTDSVKLSWTSDGADSITWVRSASDVDPVSLPYANQYPSGTLLLSTVAGPSQTVRLNVKGYGGEATCSTSFTITSSS